MRIKNNSTYVNTTGFQRASYDFYTGNDVEYKLRLENEWYMRIYWQGVETFDNGGYVVFDTFTYDDEHLPRLKDYFSESVLTADDGKYFGEYGCFNREHFPKFMKDLRSALEYAGYDVKNNIKYVYTTEYGHDDEYINDRGQKARGTKRPHYHLMMFVTDLSLDPAVLNEFVTRLWKYGYHDNGKSVAKLKRNLFCTGLNEIDRKVRLRGLANYIGKYMHKDADYEKVMESRIDAIAFASCPRDKYYNTKQWKEAWKIARKTAYDKIATFHGQSQHFGEYALCESGFDVEQVAETGKMRMPDQQKVWKFIPIPMYYRRKLFYEQVLKDDGKLMWRLKDDELSKKFYKNKSYRQAAVMANVYTNVYNSLKVADRIKVDSWMRGRSFNDLAIYDVFFKDCMFDCDVESLTADDTLEIRLMQDFTAAGINGNEANIDKHYKLVKQDACTAFRHFDEVLNVFEPYLEKRHNDLEESYAKKKREREVLKSLGIKSRK